MWLIFIISTFEIQYTTYLHYIYQGSNTLVTIHWDVIPILSYLYRHWVSPKYCYLEWNWKFEVKVEKTSHKTSIFKPVWCLVTYFYNFNLWNLIYKIFALHIPRKQYLSDDSLRCHTYTVIPISSLAVTQVLLPWMKLKIWSESRKNKS